MKYRLTDYLVCPYHIDKPLQVHAFKVTETSPRAAYPRCDDQCMRLSRPGTEVAEDDCAACTGSDIETGVLCCPECNRWYPIVDGIPSLFIDELRAMDMELLAAAEEQLRPFRAAFEPKSIHDNVLGAELSNMQSERRARDAQAKMYDNLVFLNVFHHFEVPALMRRTEDVKSGVILEAGCGTGRLTGVFHGIAKELVSCDLSRDSIRRNRDKHADSGPPVHYVHTDITHLPFRTGAFRLVANIQVYEHIPTREARERFIGHAARVMDTDGGKLILSAYRYAGIQKMLRKQGMHRGGIPYFRFTADELKSEITSALKVRDFCDNFYSYLMLAEASH